MASETSKARLGEAEVRALFARRAKPICRVARYEKKRSCRQRTQTPHVSIRLSGRPAWINTSRFAAQRSK